MNHSLRTEARRAAVRDRALAVVRTAVRLCALAAWVFTAGCAGGPPLDGDTADDVARVRLKATPAPAAPADPGER